MTSLALTRLAIALAHLVGVAPAIGQPVDDVIELSLPAYSWVMAIPAKGFVKERDETAGDGTTRRLFATHPDTGVAIMGFLEQARPRTTSASCRELYWTGFDGTCGYLHVSKPRFTAADHILFARILEGARIIARP